MGDTNRASPQQTTTEAEMKRGAHLQGHHKLTERQIVRICALLKSTDLTGVQIAERMGFTPSTIHLINKKFKIRPAGWRSWMP